MVTYTVYLTWLIELITFYIHSYQLGYSDSPSLAMRIKVNQGSDLVRIWNHDLVSSTEAYSYCFNQVNLYSCIAKRIFMFHKFWMWRSWNWRNRHWNQPMRFWLILVHFLGYWSDQAQNKKVYYLLSKIAICLNVTHKILSVLKMPNSQILGDSFFAVHHQIKMVNLSIYPFYSFWIEFTFAKTFMINSATNEVNVWIIR